MCTLRCNAKACAKFTQVCEMFGDKPETGMFTDFNKLQSMATATRIDAMITHALDRYKSDSVNAARALRRQVDDADATEEIKGYVMPALYKEASKKAAYSTPQAKAASSGKKSGTG